MGNQKSVCPSAKRRRVNSSSAAQYQLSPRKSVLFLDDTWLEALKHLTCPLWSQMSLVCRQVNGVIHRNLSRLPRQVIENVDLTPAHFQIRPGFDHIKFFMIPAALQLLYHPASYLESVRMFIVNQNSIDSLRCNIDSLTNEPRYIRCILFSLEESWIAIDTHTVDLFNPLKWMERNVRAETIRISQLNLNEALILFAKFLLDPSGAKQCASKNIEVSMSDTVQFVNILIQNFLKTPLVERGIPMIEFWYPRQEELPAYLGINLINQEVDSQGADALYTISNGQNRMRISFFQAHIGFKCKIRIYST